MHLVAGMLMVAAWMLYFLRFHDPAFQLIVYAGWAVLAAGLALIFSSMFFLRTRGQPEEGRDFTQTTQLVQSGLYAVVRHPLYLGWLLMYLAAMFLSQHWVVAVLALLGVACMVLIVRQEDRLLAERFGDAYESYMAAVPALNLAVGVARLLRRPGRR